MPKRFRALDPRRGSGIAAYVIEFALLCAREFNLTGLWGFEYAHICSKPHLDAFGGGAHVLDLTGRKIVASIGTHDWLSQMLEEDDPHA